MPASHPAGPATIDRSTLPNVLGAPDPSGSQFTSETARWIHRMIWAFVVAGLSMRVLRYLLCFPLWGDEAALAANLLDRGLTDLLQPLDFQQVAPPLFLCIEWLLVKLLGFNEWSLRVFPLLSSIGSILLFRHVAIRVLATTSERRSDIGLPFSIAPLLAVAIFSVSYYPLRHGVEAKQYASDLFIALALLASAIEWCLAPHLVRWLWGLVLAVPVALGLSHPAVFVAGGISVALLPLVWRLRTGRILIPFVTFNLALIATFGCLFVISTGPQMVAAGREGVMHSYWSGAFPPVAHPVQMVTWFVAIHSGQLFAYPAGGTEFGSGAFTLFCFAVGAIFLFRSERRFFLLLCLAPFALTFVAAALQRYPYGGFARTSQHLTPMICLISGAGAARLIGWLRRDTVRRRVFAGCIASLALFAVGLMICDVTHPYRTEHDQRVREFARWFWNEKAIDAELVCARADLNQPFFRQTYLWRGIAQYLCNQRIYSTPKRQVQQRPDWNALSQDHPLRCVVFSRPGLSRDEAAFDAWLADLQSRFAWVGYERNDFHKPHEHGPDIERIEVYEFVPRTDMADPLASAPQRFRQPADRRAN